MKIVVIFFFISAFFYFKVLSLASILSPPFSTHAILSLNLLFKKIKLSCAWEFKCKMATQKNIYKNMHSTSRILGQMFKTFVFDFSFDKCIPNVSREFFNIFLCFFCHHTQSTAENP